MSPKAATLQPLALKTLSHQQVMINNLVSGGHACVQLHSQIDGQPCQIALTPFTTAKQLDFELQLSVDGLPARVQLPRDLFSSIQIGGTPLSELLDQLPDELRLGCLHMVLERLLLDLRAALQRDVRLQRIGRCEPIIDGTPCLALNIAHNGHSCHGLLVINDQIHGQLHSAMGTAPQPSADGIAITAAVEIGHTVISDRSLLQLAVSDIVLIDRCWYRDRRDVLLRLSPRQGYLCALDGSQVTLKQLIRTGESDMSDDFDDFDDLDDDLDLDDGFEDENDDLGLPEAAIPPEMPRAGQPSPHPEPPPATTAATAAPAPQQVQQSDVQGLPVKLSFDVGHQELTVGDMGRLGPGYTFELNRDLTSPVTMTANGKPFALCELVSINNQLGARIVKLL